MSRLQTDQSEIKPANAAQIKYSASSQNIHIKVDLLTIVHDKIVSYLKDPQSNIFLQIIKTCSLNNF